MIDAGTAARAAVDLLVWGKVSSLVGDTDDETAYHTMTDAYRPTGDGRAPGCGFGWRIRGHSNRAVSSMPLRGAAHGMERIAWWPAAVQRGSGLTHRRPLPSQVPRRTRSQPRHCATLARLRAKNEPRRLVGFLKTYGQQREFLENPTPSERANIAESLATVPCRGDVKCQLLGGSAFYRDLVKFMDEVSLRRLQGVRIILCGDGMLRSWTQSVDAVDEATGVRPRRRRRRGEKVEASLFFPPAPRPDG